MKLNKNGWGTASMIFYMSILLTALLVVTIMIYRLYSTKDAFNHTLNNKNPQINGETSDNKTYHSYENSIKQNAITYVYTYYQETLSQEPIKITVGEMVDKKIMEPIYDNGAECDGYALVKVEEGKIISEPYLQCNSYNTQR